MRILYTSSKNKQQTNSVAPIIILCAVILGVVGIRYVMISDMSGFSELAVSASAVFTNGFSSASAGGRIVLPPIIVDPNLLPEESYSESPPSVIQVTALFGSDAVMPLVGQVTSAFAERDNPFSGAKEMHTGVDIAPIDDSVIRSIYSGKVSFVGSDVSYGNYIVVDHGQGVESLYAHCSRFYVREGDAVYIGMPIALVGSSGQSTASHLHFEVRVDGEAIDPFTIIGGAIEVTRFS